MNEHVHKALSAIYQYHMKAYDDNGVIRRFGALPNPALHIYTAVIPLQMSEKMHPETKRIFLTEIYSVIDRVQNKDFAVNFVKNGLIEPQVSKQEENQGYTQVLKLLKETKDLQEGFKMAEETLSDPFFLQLYAKLSAESCRLDEQTKRKEIESLATENAEGRLRDLQQEVAEIDSDVALTAEEKNQAKAPLLVMLDNLNAQLRSTDIER